MDSMDETTRTIPLELNGRSFKASRLTSGQQMIIAGMDTDNIRSADLSDIIDIIRACVGDQEWAQIKRGLISGEISSHEVLDLFSSIANAPESVRVDVPLSPVVDDPEIARAEATLRALMEKRGQLNDA